MCEECTNLDEKIQRYRKFVAQGLDALTVERIQGLIKELEQRKASLH